MDLLAKGVEEEGADEDEGEAEADEEGDDAGDEQRGASVLLKIQIQMVVTKPPRMPMERELKSVKMSLPNTSVVAST